MNVKTADSRTQRYMGMGGRVTTVGRPYSIHNIYFLLVDTLQLCYV